MKKYFLDVLIHHYADFSGKATRTQYWLWVLWSLFVVVLLMGLTYLVHIFGIVLGIVALGILVPNIAITVRRLRDGGFSPWLGFLMLPYFLSQILGHLPESFFESLGSIGYLVGIMMIVFGLLTFVCNVALLILMCLPSKNVD